MSILGSNDMYNFHPFLTADERIRVWEDLLMRPVEMEYTGDSSVLGISTLRFQVCSALALITERDDNNDV